MNKSSYPNLRLKAIKLRRRGLSYGEIRKSIPVAKSTLSLWLKTVSLTTKQRRRLYTKSVFSLNLGPQSQKERRIREINEIVKKAGKEINFPLSLETYRLLGSALYWAEGSKTGKFMITNSDPELILFMVNWFKRIFNVYPSRLKAKLNIYPQQNDLKLKKFWSQLTGIPLENFNKSFIKPLNKGYKKNNLYYGTIGICVSKGTDLRHRVYEWIKAVLKDTLQKSELTLNEWRSLKDVFRPVNLSRK